MNYVTTNIRILEEDYLRLKQEAAKKRKSLSAIIREKIKAKGQTQSKSEVEKIIQELDKTARENSKYLKRWNSLKALREIRQNSKW